MNVLVEGPGPGNKWVAIAAVGVNLAIQLPGVESWLRGLQLGGRGALAFPSLPYVVICEVDTVTGPGS